MIDRFERVDRRFAQQEQRLERLSQRVIELGDRLDVLLRMLCADRVDVQAPRLPVGL